MVKKKKISTDAFVAAWRSAESLDEVAAATGTTRSSASQLATRLRRSGVELKSFRDRGQRAESTSDRAAREARAERATFRAVAARHGISYQAVQQAYVRLYPGEPSPTGDDRGDVAARSVALELVREGLPDDAVAAEVGFSAGYVGMIRRAVGIDRVSEKSAAMEAAIEAVRRGAPASRAAAAHGVSYGRLAERCRSAGVALVTPITRTGAAVAAADLVERGTHTVAEAAREAGCTDPAVFGVLRRRGPQRSTTPATSSRLRHRPRR